MQEQRKYRTDAAREEGERRFPKITLNRRRLVSESAAGLGWVAISFLLGLAEFFFSTYPAGLALLCAAESRITYIMIGLCAAAIASGHYPALYIAAFFTALIVRVVTRVFIDTTDRAELPEGFVEKIRAINSGLFRESVSLRMTVASLCAFVVGLYSIIVGGYRYYDLFGTLFAVVAAPALVWLLVGFCRGDGKKKRVRLRYLAGVATVVGGGCYAMREVYLFGISVCAFAALLVTLWMSRREGVLYGSVIGFVCGIALDPIYAPLFILSAIAEGLLQSISPILASSAAFAVAMTWGLYIDGIDALGRLMPALLLSSALFCGVDRSGLLDGDKLLTADRPSPREEELSVESDRARCRTRSDEERLMAVSESFASLSEIFYNLSDRLRRPGILDLRHMCDNVFDRHCPDCPSREVCWGLEYGASLDMIAKLCTSLHERGRVDNDCIPQNIRSRCKELESIVGEINSGCATLSEAVLRGEKAGVFALDYDAMSHILAEAVEEQREDFDRAEDAEAKVRAALEKMGMYPDALFVYGQRRKYICARGIDVSRTKTDAESLRMRLESACGCALEDPLFEFYGGNGRGRLSMTLTTRRRYTAERACLTASAEGDEKGAVCGDSVCMFENNRDYFYALISDGMGTGGGAAFNSGVCSLFLEKMLMAGNRTATVLRMLNGVLRSKGGARQMESSATVDLLELDLLNGRASIVKSGAAPTYIRRDGDIFKIHSKTVPIGILAAIDAQRTELEISEGDIIVLVSDGISDAALSPDATSEGGSPDGWLVRLLSDEWEDDLDRMTHKIVGRARALGSRDDLSVIIVRIGLY